MSRDSNRIRTGGIPRADRPDLKALAETDDVIALITAAASNRGEAMATDDLVLPTALDALLDSDPLPPRSSKIWDFMRDFMALLKDTEIISFSEPEPTPAPPDESRADRIINSTFDHMGMGELGRNPQWGDYYEPPKNAPPQKDDPLS